MLLKLKTLERKRLFAVAGNRRRCVRRPFLCELLDFYGSRGGGGGEWRGEPAWGSPLECYYFGNGKNLYTLGILYTIFSYGQSTSCFDAVKLKFYISMELIIL